MINLGSCFLLIVKYGEKQKGGKVELIQNEWIPSMIFRPRIATQLTFNGVSAVFVVAGHTKDPGGYRT